MDKVFKLLNKEYDRQNDSIDLIASENLASHEVMMVQGSVLTNKYSEGYPGRRYYGGCQYIDEIEEIAIERACKLFGAKYANVQPNSGSQANQGVFQALLNPGDTILGMSLDAGGHLTHGAKPNQSGKWFNSIQYGLNDEGLIDYDQIHDLAERHFPSLIIAGASAYPRTIDWKKFKEISQSVGAKLMVDMAHYAGLIAGGVYPNPLPYADVVTSTTHKTLRGPRGGLILTNNEYYIKKINSAIFPGIQGGPLNHVIAAKAVAFGEALDESFKDYAQQTLKNSRILAKTLIDRGFNLVTNGTDSHMILVDLRNKKITGAWAEKELEIFGLVCNKNAVVNDPEPPTKTSGIRLGTPSGTTRGFKETEFIQIGNWIADVLNEKPAYNLRETIKTLCNYHPITQSKIRHIY